MSATRRAALADLERLTTALRDDTDQLAERLAAVEAIAYPRNKKSPRPRQRRGLQQHKTTSPLRPGDPMRTTTVPEPDPAPQWPATSTPLVTEEQAEAYAAGWRPPTWPLQVPTLFGYLASTGGVLTVPVCSQCGALPGDVDECARDAAEVAAAFVKPIVRDLTR